MCRPVTPSASGSNTRKSTAARQQSRAVSSASFEQAATKLPAMAPQTASAIDCRFVATFLSSLVASRRVGTR